MHKTVVAGLIACLMPITAWAGAQATAVLDVRNMNCGLCPLTVRNSLERVPGVAAVQVEHDPKTATVRFDTDRTSPAALLRATTDAGFPSSARP